MPPKLRDGVYRCKRCKRGFPKRAVLCDDCRKVPRCQLCGGDVLHLAGDRRKNNGARCLPCMQAYSDFLHAMASFDHTPCPDELVEARVASYGAKADRETDLFDGGTT